MIRRIADAFVRLPFTVRMGLLFVVVIGIFLAVVGPLFASGGPLLAEIDGRLPASLHGSANTPIDLDIDNTGDGLIDPICLKITTSPAGEAKTVTFQGLETIAVKNELACGGELTAKESISVVIALDLTKGSSVAISVTPQRKSTAIGTTLHGTILIKH